MKSCSKVWCGRNCQSNQAMKRWGKKCMAQKLPCIFESMDKHQNVKNVLGKTLKDGEPFVKLLTKDELIYCIHTETRQSGLHRLETRKKEIEKGGSN